MDLTKILEVGDKVYSPLCGNGTVLNTNYMVSMPIMIQWEGGTKSTFTKEGKYYTYSPECILFPSENNKDWSTYTKKKHSFNPFDKVLVRDDAGNDQDHWCCDFFSHIDKNDYFVTSGGEWGQCIPYNKETQHLIGTNQDCPDKYKIW